MRHEENIEPSEVGDKCRLLDEVDLQELRAEKNSKKTERLLVGAVVLLVFLCGLTAAAIIHLVSLKRDKCTATYGCS